MSGTVLIMSKINEDRHECSACGLVSYGRVLKLCDDAVMIILCGECVSEAYEITVETEA